MTLQELVNHFGKLYGHRNSILISGRMERLHVLQEGVAILRKMLSKENPQSPAVQAAFASVVGRLFAVIDSFRGLPFIDAMLFKFPSYGCAYCGTKPCSCDANRPDPRSNHPIDDTQRQWTLTEWTRHLDAVYGTHHNRGFGYDFLCSRINDEITEVEVLERKIHAATGSLHDIAFAYAKEIGDVLSWIIAVANFLHVDLEAAVMARYEAGCPQCAHTPCDCPHVVHDPFSPDAWKSSAVGSSSI